MSKKKSQIDDKELESVTGGIGNHSLIQASADFAKMTADAQGKADIQAQVDTAMAGIDAANNATSNQAKGK